MSSLPEWDLSDLYPAPDAPALTEDLAAAEADAKAFAAQYKGQVAALDGAALGGAIAAYEAMQERLGRLMSYAQLLFSGDATDGEIGRFFQMVQERATDISSHVLFFTLEINKIEEVALEEKLKAPELAHYRPWLRDLRVFRPHQLEEDLERLLHDKDVSGRSAWVRLFDETMAALRFPVDSEELTASDVLNRLSDADPERRKAAAKSLGKVFGENISLFVRITNTLAKDKEIQDRWRQYPRATSARNLANQVEDEVVDALVDSVTGSYGDLSHRYYALKARWMGVDKLDYWDRNAPLPEQDDRDIPWDEARRRVLDAYAGFSPDLAEIGQRFFDNPWIDVPPRPGKASGAFAHPTVPSAHPYLLLNYHGKVRDVMTLAHELGHGVHQVLAAEQGYFMSSTPLTLAETASVFGEMLTFQSLLADETDPTRRRVMLASKVEDMINTVVRQIAFYQFERAVHTARREEGELGAERLGDIWMQVQGDSLGPALRFEDEYRAFWSYIPHFIHSPFYVYAYAFGDCLVNSLYDLFRNGHPEFQRKYLEMLKAGGTLHHKDLLAPFGLDASDRAFWQRGLGVVSGFIDELEETF